MQGKKPKKNFTLSEKAVEALKRLSAGNYSFVIEKLILEADEKRNQTEGQRAS